MIGKDPAKELIIERPDLQTRGRRTLYGLFTLFAWAVWIYLWLPLLTFFGWLAGGWFFREQFVVQTRNGYAQTLFAYMGVILALAVVLVGWSIYNRRRFGRLGRRKPRPIASDEEMAAAFGISVVELRRLRTMERGVLRFSPSGNIEGFEETRASDALVAISLGDAPLPAPPAP